MQVALAKMGGDLVWKFPIVCPLDGLQCSVKGTMYSTHKIVQLSGRRIQVQDQPGKASMLQFGNGSRGQQWSCRKRQKRMQASLRCMLHQFVNILPLQGICARENENGRGQFTDFIYQLQGFQSV